MTACAKCGHDPDARVVASWAFFIPREVESLNGRAVNAGKSRWRYAAKRDGWQRDMLTIRRTEGIPIAVRKRRVTVSRFYAGRQRELDASNFVGGCKPLWDAMVRAGLLVDDKPTCLEDHYEQVRGAEAGTRILIEELEGA